MSYVFTIKYLTHTNPSRLTQENRLAVSQLENIVKEVLSNLTLPASAEEIHACVNYVAGKQGIPAELSVTLYGHTELSKREWHKQSSLFRQLFQSYMSRRLAYGYSFYRLSTQHDAYHPSKKYAIS